MAWAFPDPVGSEVCLHPHVTRQRLLVEMACLMPFRRVGRWAGTTQSRAIPAEVWAGHGACEYRLVRFSAKRVGWSRSGCRGGQDGLGGLAEILDHRIRVALAAGQDDLAGGSALDRDGDEVGTQ